MANVGKVLVTGATGNTDSGVVSALVDAGIPVRALCVMSLKRSRSGTRVWRS
jgi:hypothetical protein